MIWIVPRLTTSPLVVGGFRLGAGDFFCCLAFVHVRGSCFVSSREVGGFRVILRSRSSFRGCDHSPIADLCRGIFLILFFFLPPGVFDSGGRFLGDSRRA